MGTYTVWLAEAALCQGGNSPDNHSRQGARLSLTRTVWLGGGHPKHVASCSTTHACREHPCDPPPPRGPATQVGPFTDTALIRNPNSPDKKPESLSKLDAAVPRHACHAFADPPLRMLPT